jgi:hypothetical protein
VVSETLQLDAAGACLFSYLLKAKPDGYSDGLCRPCALHASGPSHHLSAPPSSAVSPFPYPYRVIGMVMIAFVGVATFDKSGTGATSILQAVIWVSPKRQLRNATLAPSCALYASCAAALADYTCTRFSDKGFSPHRSKYLGEEPIYVRLSGAEEGSLVLLLLCRWLSLACAGHPPISNYPQAVVAQKA